MNHSMSSSTTSNTFDRDLSTTIAIACNSSSRDIHVIATMTNNRPTNIGTYHNIPEDILTLSGLQRNKIVAWTAYDTKLDLSIEQQAFCQTCGPFIILPFLWPFALLFSICLLASKNRYEEDIKNQYWILTETELRVVLKKYAIDDTLASGSSMRVVRLRTISECGTTTPSGRFCDEVTVPTIYIDTIRSRLTKHIGVGNQQQHEIVGYGLKGHEWFAQEIICRRDIITGNYHQMKVAPSPDIVQQQAMVDTQQPSLLPPTVTVPAAGLMERGRSNSVTTTNTNTTAENTATACFNTETIEGRLATAKDLYESGLINAKEYEKKRQEIIATI